MSKTTYPNFPGHKAEEPETSRAAAVRVAGRAETLRARCLEVIRRKPMTADEAAAEIGEDRLSVRPRLTELLRFKKIEDTGQRRKNASGSAAAVWRATGSLKQADLFQ